MEIIKRMELIDKIKEHKLIPLEVKSLKMAQQILLEIEKIDDFLKFASNSNFEYIYFYYTYYDLGQYIIPEDWYSDEYEKELKNEVRLYNKQIKSIDFGSPKNLKLFVLQNGTLVGIELIYPWIENDGIEVSEFASEKLENQFHSEVRNAKTKKKDKQKEDENKLREIIFNDVDFSIYKKNQDLRYWYLVELLEKEGMEKFKYLVHPYGISVNGKVKSFMDITMILYKNREKN